MKRRISIVLFFAALSLTCCTKDAPVIPEQNTEEPEVVVPEKKAFTVKAVPGDVTRTSNNGYATRWAVNDAVNFWTAPAGKKAGAKSHGEYKILTEEDAETGTFTGTMAEPLDSETEYDWFLMYSFKARADKFLYGPQGKHFLTVGSDVNNNSPIKGTANTQDGINSKAHLCGGDGFPMQGKATAKGAARPTIVMNQITSVVEVDITNKYDTAYAIGEIILESDNHNLTGRYIWEYVGGAFQLKDIDFDSESEYKTRVSKTASLKITDGTGTGTAGVSIPAGTTASFYLGIHPHDMTAGDRLTVTVKRAKGQIYYQKDITNTTTSFVAGHIKKISMEMSAEKELK